MEKLKNFPGKIRLLRARQIILATPSEETVTVRQNVKIGAFWLFRRR